MAAKWILGDVMNLLAIPGLNFHFLWHLRIFFNFLIFLLVILLRVHNYPIKDIAHFTD